MDTKLNDYEFSILLSANKAGQITIPSGSAMEIDRFLATLLHLEEAGYVSRSKGGAFYRPFVLTKRGKAIKGSPPEVHPRIGMLKTM